MNNNVPYSTSLTVCTTKLIKPKKRRHNWNAFEDYVFVKSLKSLMSTFLYVSYTHVLYRSTSTAADDFRLLSDKISNEPTEHYMFSFFSYWEVASFATYLELGQGIWPTAARVLALMKEDGIHSLTRLQVASRLQVLIGFFCGWSFYRSTFKIESWFRHNQLMWDVS
jgi:hypothetical protein